ncbi:MAG: ABC transporter substrate-binding protein [Bacilli bacterium]
MKKTLISIILFLVVVAVVIFGIFQSKKEESNLTKVTLAEVAHSIFYAPQYAAISEGYFEEEGIDLEVVLTPGADAVMSSVLSGDVDIGFSGTEATIYVYNGGEKDYPMTFAGLTKRDGAFLVSRKKIDNFTLDDLKGKTVIGGRKGGMPEMTFEWALRQNGIDPKNDLTIDTSIAFAAMQGAFIGGTGDFVTLFEPNATAVEKEGLGYVVAYVGSFGGEVPYTAYNARKSYIEENPEIIKGFTRAIDKGLKFVLENEPEKIADSIITFFPDTSINDLTTMIKRYKENDAWRSSIVIDENEWIHIQDIMIASGELDKYVSYESLIYDEYFDEFR